MRPIISSPSKSDESSRESSTTSPHSSPQTDFLSPTYTKQKHKIEKFSSGPSNASVNSDAKKLRLSTVPMSVSEFFVDSNEHYGDGDGLPRCWMDDMKPVFDKGSVSVFVGNAKRNSESTSPSSLISEAAESPLVNIPNASSQIFAEEFPEIEDNKKGGKKPVADCNVCGDRAIAHMHYGGICCYSCKAFFRRASQTGNDKNYKCKKDENCVVSVNNRRSCQYCRFMKCLAIGMKPTWVLSDKQCQIRFRKGKGDGKVKFDGDKVVVKIEDGVKEDNKTLIKILKPLIFQFTTEEEKTVIRMTKKYEESKEMCSFSQENKGIFKKLFLKNNTESGQDSSYTWNDLDSLIETVIKKHVFFLESSQLVNDLNPNDLLKLFKQNLTETTHLRGAIRFDVKSENFAWYFNKKDQMQLAYQKPGCSSLTVKNAAIGQADMSKYYDDKVSGDIFRVIRRLCELGLPTEVYLILIYVSLFASDGVVQKDDKMYSNRMELIDRHIVEKNQVEILLLLHRYLVHLYGCDGRMKLSQIMGVMVDLREVCDKSKESIEKNKRKITE